MAEKIMFKIGLTDYSKNVVGENYSVQSNDEYETWTDANGKEHRSAYRQRISGTFEMYFPTMADYTNFASLLATSKHSDLTYSVTIYDNKTGIETNANVFLDYNLVQYRDSGFRDRMERVKVTVREQ